MGRSKVKRIVVYFSNGFKAEFDRDKVAFKDRDGTFFTLSNVYPQEDDYVNLVSEGRTFINFDNVCYVQEEKEPADYEE